MTVASSPVPGAVSLLDTVGTGWLPQDDDISDAAVCQGTGGWCGRASWAA